MDSMLERFNSELSNIMNTKKCNSFFLTKERYDNLLKKVKDSKNKINGKKPEDYRRLKRYDVMQVGNVERLIFPLKNGSDNIKFYVHFEELFNIIHEIHLLIGHAGRDRMAEQIQKCYKNITQEVVMIYLGLCEHCQKRSKRGVLGKPVSLQETNTSQDNESVSASETPLTSQNGNEIPENKITTTVNKNKRANSSPNPKNNKKQIHNHLQRRQEMEDRCDIFSKMVGWRLRNLEIRQLLIAEKMINDILYEAEMGALNSPTPMSRHVEQFEEFRTVSQDEDEIIPEVQIKEEVSCQFEKTKQDLDSDEVDLKDINCDFDEYKDLKQLAEEYDCDNNFQEYDNNIQVNRYSNNLFTI